MTISTEQKNINILARTDTKEYGSVKLHRITVAGKSFTALDMTGKSDAEFRQAQEEKFGESLESCT